MQPEDASAPDLENGFAIVSGKENAWRTEIQSILKFEDNGNCCYLTHECRAESLSESAIFGEEKYEFLPIKTPDGNFNIRSGVYNYGFLESEPNTIYEKFNNKIEIICPIREIYYLGYKETIKAFEERDTGRYFVELEYILAGRAYKSMFPARYINFPDPTSGKKYLQPISGYVLFYNGVKYLISYVGIHMSEKKCHVEFIAREPASFFSLKNKNSRMKKLLAPFHSITDRLFKMDEFHKIYQVSGKAKLFRYK